MSFYFCRLGFWFVTCYVMLFQFWIGGSLKAALFTGNLLCMINTFVLNCDMMFKDSTRSGSVSTVRTFMNGFAYFLRDISCQMCQLFFITSIICAFSFFWFFSEIWKYWFQLSRICCSNHSPYESPVGICVFLCSILKIYFHWNTHINVTAVSWLLPGNHNPVYFLSVSKI